MKLKLLFLSLFICTFVSAQNFIMKKKLADRYYSRFDYYKAIPMYEQLLMSYPHNLSICEKLADSYRRINDSQNAEHCYAQLMDSSYVAPDVKLFYAQTLARNGKYEKAILWYEKYSKDKPDDIRGFSFAKAYKSLNQFYTDSAAYNLRKAAFNGDNSDFSPVYYKSGVVFASARPNFSVVKIWYNWTSSSYLDLYFSYPDSVKAIPFSGSVNSKYHEGPVTFSPNQDTIIFTRSNYNNLHFRKSNEGINKLKLYQAHWNKLLNKWSDISPLTLNSDQFSVGHPALANNGHTLYFASDMPGGFGGTDIYVSMLVTDSMGHSKWGNPVNLGSNINTPGNEVFPYVDVDGNLWFSSNGLPGLGGLDIFEAYANKTGFSIPKNIGVPINSRFDDFGIIIRNGGHEGLFTSDRYSQVGNDDIYQFTLNKLMIKGIVRDSTLSRSIDKAMVYLILADGMVAGKIETGTDGSFEFPLSINNDYSIKAEKQGYLSQSKKFSTAGLGNSLLKEDFYLCMETSKPVILMGIMVNKKTGEKLSDVDINIVDTIKNVMVLDTTTYADGSFRKVLGTVKLNDHLGYRVILTKKGYLAKNIPFKHVVTKYEINLNDFLEVALDKIDVGMDIGKLLQINPIYFDLGKSNIRPDASVELDKVVKAMNDNPGIVIELGSHTDSRGSSQSNLLLSDKRAKASAAYIISKGIDKSRIYGKGYGKTKLLNKCADGVQCTEAEHAVNRRTEFKIVNY